MGTRELEPSVNAMICALCADYFRRDRIIKERSATRRVDTEFRYYNFRIYDGAAEIVGDELAEVYIKEIAERRGYANSLVEDVSEPTYKRYKKEVKEAIAKKLYLIE